MSEEIVVLSSEAIMRNIKPERIWFGIVIRLGFRLGLPSLFAWHAKERTSSFFALNLGQSPARGSDDDDDSRTRVLIALKPRTVDPILVARIRTGVLDGPIIDHTTLHDYLAVFRHLVLAYLKTIGTWQSGGRIRLPTKANIMNPYVCVAFALDARGSIPDDLAVEALQYRPKWYVSDMTHDGVAPNLDSEEIEAFKDHLDDSDNTVVDELVLKAINAMVDGDQEVALVLACAAMEGSHGALFRVGMGDFLSEAPDRDELMNNLLREQGIHTLFRLTLRMFVPSDLRPSTDVINECKQALEIRNTIVHVKRSKAGFKVRDILPKDIQEAYRSVLAVHEAFSRSLRQLGTNR